MKDYRAENENLCCGSLPVLGILEAKIEVRRATADPRWTDHSFESIENSLGRYDFGENDDR